MKITFLTENTVLQSHNLLAEHGLSIYIEDEGTKVLFDTGYSDVFIKNSFKMGINLLELDYIIISHGHYDHTWGLVNYLSFYFSAAKLNTPHKKPTIIAHPDTFNPKHDDKMGNIGSLLTKEALSKTFELKLTSQPLKITQNLLYLGQIPRNNNFEAQQPIGKVLKDNNYQDDYIIEDSALTYNSMEGIVIITGCSHSGICNIIDHARNIHNGITVSEILGGFHLLKPLEDNINKTINHLLNSGVKTLYPCHCTDFHSKIKLAKYIKTNPPGVGFTLEYNNK